MCIIILFLMCVAQLQKLNVVCLNDKCFLVICRKQKNRVRTTAEKQTRREIGGQRRKGRMRGSRRGIEKDKGEEEEEEERMKTNRGRQEGDEVEEDGEKKEEEEEEEVE